MKKVLPLMLLICVLLCGCRENVPAIEVTEEPMVIETVAPTEETQAAETLPIEEVYTQLPMNAIALPIVTEKNDNQDDTFTYQNIYLFCQDQEVADRIILDFLNCQDNHRKISTSSDQYEILLDPVRLDDFVLSLFGKSVSHQGAHHPVVACQSANYNMLTGEVLTLGSILKDSNSLQLIHEQILAVAESIAEDSQLYSDYSQVIADRFTRNPNFDEDWFFSSSGLSFYFEPYEIAPYTSGVVILEIPYEQLTGLIDDSFFPAEEDLSEGRLMIEPITDVDLGDYSQIAEITLSGDADGIVLYSEGLLRDIRIETVDDHSQTMSTTIFAAHTLSPGDGIILKYGNCDTSSTFTITYRSAQETFVQRISLSEDDSFVLS